MIYKAIYRTLNFHPIAFEAMKYLVSAICLFGSLARCLKQYEANADLKARYAQSTAIDFYDLARMENFGIYSSCINPHHIATTYDDGIHP